jgi:hypothetical protein
VIVRGLLGGSEADMAIVLAAYVRQTVALVALLFSLISLVGWMAFLVFAGNEFLEGHLLPVLGIGAGGLITIGVLVGGWPNGWGRRAWYKCVSKSLRL